MSTRIRHLAGSHNVRDLGGLATTDGRRVAPDLVFRSDYPAFAEDRDLLDGLGLRTVVDLRRGSEAAHECVPWADLGVAYHRCPVTAFDRSSWEARYTSYLLDRPETVVEAVRLVLDPGNHPVLFHCAAGKDRTGVVAALVLSVLGVPDDQIVADYVLTARTLELVLARLADVPIYRAELEGATTDSQRPRAESMRSLLGWIAARGGAERWLTDQGVTAAELAAARAALVVDRPDLWNS